MRVLVTGACGFVGAAVVQRLLASPQSLNRSPGLPLTLVLIDRSLPAQGAPPAAGTRVFSHAGDLADSRLLRRALADGVDLAFHLASVPGGSAEKDPVLGRKVNLEATLELFEQLAEQATPPRVVFASSVAVYGGSPRQGIDKPVDPHTPLRPRLSYGAHKLVAEILLADLSRRGRLDGMSLRLPGIVARPLGPSGLVSAYMSDILRRVAAGEPFTCPVSPQATSWWMSVRCCVDNLLHAANIDTTGLDTRRAWPLPVLHFSMQALVDTLARIYGAEAAGRVRWAPDENVESVFGRYPPLDASEAEALGFRHDGSIEALVRNALEQTD
jgi:nucleoside-diphosphate-sugar epimerase